ncbi:MAG: contact-dependent growth inhibition system immunity protein [Pseudomonadota bacterium]
MISSKSLEELDGENWGDPTFDSHLVKESHRLRKVPIGQLTAENLRLLIGQAISLHYTVPLAVSMLEQDILASGKMYQGDLLCVVAAIEDGFWRKNPDLNNRLVEVKIEVEQVKQTLSEALKNLGRREFL